MFKKLVKPFVVIITLFLALPLFTPTSVNAADPSLITEYIRNNSKKNNIDDNNINPSKFKTSLSQKGIYRSSYTIRVMEHVRVVAPKWSQDLEAPEKHKLEIRADHFLTNKTLQQLESLKLPSGNYGNILAVQFDLYGSNSDSKIYCKITLFENPNNYNITALTSGKDFEEAFSKAVELAVLKRPSSWNELNKINRKHWNIAKRNDEIDKALETTKYFATNHETFCELLVQSTENIRRGGILNPLAPLECIDYLRKAIQTTNSLGIENRTEALTEHKRKILEDFNSKLYHSNDPYWAASAR